MNNKFMMLAINEARKAYKRKEIPVGAVIVKNNKVVAKSFNKKERFKCSLGHAEIGAIKKACGKLKNWRLNDCVMYVTLYPCPMCASAIKQSRIAKVVYLYDSMNLTNKKISEEIFNCKDANKPVEIVKIVLSSSDNNFLSDFFKEKRSKQMF